MIQSERIDLEQNAETSENINNEIEFENTKKRVDVEYGDIIQIVSPSNPELHEAIFFINYIDEQNCKLINVSSKEFVDLNVRADTGGFTDESILKIVLLDRSELSGYARQKGLIPKTWIDIYFRGFPTITGEITNLEEDQIEITTYPQLKIFYIDFAYRGLPETIPIEKFVIREKPHTLKNVSTLTKLREEVANEAEFNERMFAEEDEEATQEYLPTGESIIHIPEGVQPDSNIHDLLREQFAKVKPSGLVFGDYLDSIEQFIEIPESKKRYGIDMQVTSYMDELLSTIPYNARSNKVMNRIHILVERYKELREMYSTYDTTGNIKGLKRHDPTTYKPLVNHLENMDTKLHWILPTVVYRRKIYDIETTNDDVSPYILEYELHNEENMKNTTYYNNGSNTEENKYGNMMRQLNEYMTPYENYDILSGQNSFLKTLSVNAPVEAFVSSLPEERSSVYSNEEIKSDRFFRQTYTLPMTRMTKSIKFGKTQYVPENITDADSMTIRSFIQLPLPAILYSRVGLPGTNIMERSHYGQISWYPFLAFHKNTDIETVTINDLMTEIEHIEFENDKTKNDDIDKNIEFKYLTKLTRYMLDGECMEDENKYRKFLQVILPKTRVIIRLLRKYVKDCYTFTRIVELLEPFLVYSEDVSYKQYMEIRYLIKKQIESLKADLANKTKEYDSYKLFNYFNIFANKTSVLHRLLEEKKELTDLFSASYNVSKFNKETKTTYYSDGELLHKILMLDGGNLYTKLLISLMSVLNVPESILAPLEKPLLEYSEDNVKSSDCSTRVLTKKYNKMEELEKDNNTEDVFFDKELDETPYHLVKKYETEKKEMSPEKFIAYFAENLIQKHDCPREKADMLAKTIIEGKRKIKDGEYAVLEIPKNNDSNSKSIDESISEENEDDVYNQLSSRSKTKYHYYVRRKTIWILDEDVEETSFLPTNQLFCNLKPGCFKNSSVDKTCIDKTSEKQIFQNVEKRQALKDVETEFERRFEESREYVRENINVIIANKVRYNVRLQVLKQILAEKTNYLAFSMGESIDTNETNASVCPYYKLKQSILGQTDFIERQMNIVRFTETLCREPMVESRNEDPYWKYCEETNVKLLPSFLYELAKTYVNFGSEAYGQKLEDIIARQGVEEDGIIYDKYSEEIIQRIDFVGEESYTEQGFRVVSSGILEKDLGTIALDAMNQKKSSAPIFENELAEEIYAIFSAISKYIAEFSDVMRDQILRMSSEILEKEIPNEDAYNRQAKAREKSTGKKAISFKTMRNKKLIQTIMATMLISIQTAIPSFKSTKTFPGCILSFDGYPMKGEENIRGIEYFACIVSKIAEDFEPWNSVNKLNAAVLAKQQLEYLKKLSENPQIFALYENKRNYLAVHPDEEIPIELSVQKWKRFLPPLIPTRVAKHVSAVSSGYIKEFWDLVKKGHRDQTTHWNVISSKTALYGQSIIDNIQSIVSKTDLILKTSARVPFLQNACCNEKRETIKDAHHPIRYFMQQEPDSPILHTVKIVYELSKTLQKIHLTTVPSILAFQMTYKPVNNIPLNLIEENIYAAMIHYCGLDRGEIPTEMRGFISEIPANYDAKKTMMEKVQGLKEKKRFGRDELNELMTIVRKRNLIQIEYGSEPNLLDRFGDAIRQMEKPIHEVTFGLNLKIRESLRALIAGFVPNRFYSNDQVNLEEIKNLDKLKNALVSVNQTMYSEIMNFIEKYANISGRDMEKIHEFLSTIHIWRTDNTNNLYEVLQFFKNAIYDLTHYFPSLMTNRTKESAVLNFSGELTDRNNMKSDSKNNRIHKYWGLSDADVSDLYGTIKKYNADLYKSQEDTTMIELIHRIHPALIDISIFFNEIPVFSTLMKDREYFQLFDKSTVYMLAQHMLFSAMYQYMIATEDMTIKRIDRETQKTQRRSNAKTQSDPLQSGYSSEILNEIEEIDMDEYTEAYQNMVEIQIEAGEQDALNRRVSEFMIVFLNMYKNNKRNLDYSYEDINKKMLTNRTKEKERIIKDLTNMKPENRRVDMLHKKHALGKWNVGIQKGIFKYDKATSERERAENIIQGISDIADETIPIGNMYANESVQLQDFSVEDFDADVERQARQDEMNEMYDFQMGSEDYTNGNYYEEDRDMDGL